MVRPWLRGQRRDKPKAWRLSAGARNDWRSLLVVTVLSLRSPYAVLGMTPVICAPSHGSISSGRPGKHDGGIRKAFWGVPQRGDQRKPSSELHRTRLAGFLYVPREWRLPEVLCGTPYEEIAGRESWEVNPRDAPSFAALRLDFHVCKFAGDTKTRPRALAFYAMSDNRYYVK